MNYQDDETAEVVSIIGETITIGKSLEEANLPWPEVRTIRACQTICVLLACSRYNEADDQTAVLNFFLHNAPCDKSIIDRAKRVCERIRQLPEDNAELGQS